MKGAIAKKFVFDTIKEVFGTAYVGEKDGKVYLNLEEEGSPVQVAIALTCPKTPLSFGESLVENAAPTVVPAFPEPKNEIAPDISKEEDEMIAKFISSFGF